MRVGGAGRAARGCHAAAEAPEDSQTAGQRAQEGEPPAVTAALGFIPDV